MKKTSRLIAVLMGIVLALSLAFLAILNGFATESKARAQAARSVDVLNSLRLAEAALLDAETGQRGYLLTQDDAYLEPFHAGIADFDRAMARLSAEGDLSAAGTARPEPDRLRTIGLTKLAELDETIRLAASGEEAAARELVRSDRGKQLMDDFRNEVSRLEAREQGALEDSLARARAVQKQTGLVLVTVLVLILALLGLILHLFRRAARLDRTEELLNEVSRHRDRAELLARELSHRVKNLFGIVSSIVRMTGRGETDAAVVVQKISQRIGALARAHALTAAEGSDLQIDLEQLIRTILEPYETENRRFALRGPKVSLDSNVLTPLGLILHEMATNAVKYGAWAQEIPGTIEVCWDRLASAGAAGGRDRLKLTWTETADPRTTPQGGGGAGPAQSGSGGFGTRMIEMCAQQLNGRLRKEWNDGLAMELIFELAERAPQKEA